MSSLSVTVTGEQGLTSLFENLEAALDTRAILDEGSAVLLNRMRDRFLRETAPDGTPWVPSFAALRRQLSGRGGGTLFDTGRLFHSLQVFAVDENTRAIGTDATSPSGFFYPAKFQYGLGVIQRVFLGFNDDDTMTMIDVIVHRLNAVVTK